MTRRMLCLFVTLLILTACSDPVRKEMPIRKFHTREFVGLVSAEPTSYGDAVLDYELDTSQGGMVRFTRCAEVESTDEQDIESSQYPLFRLLFTNCQALRRYAESHPARRSFFPARMSEELLAAFPATAVPRISDEEMKRREEKTLSEYEAVLRIAVQTDGSVQVTNKADEMTYHTMARADFDGDGTEDILMRVDWHSREAFGQGTDLFLLSKPSDSAPISVAWRLYVLPAKAGIQ